MRFCRPRWLSTCLSLLVAGLAVGPALAAPAAASARDNEGLVVLLEAWSMAPRNTNLDYAFTDVGSLTGGGVIATLEHDREWVPRFYAGWRLSSAKGTQLGMSFWEYDNTVSGGVEDPGNVGPLLGSPGFFILLIGADTRMDAAIAESRLRATQVDGGARWIHRVGDAGSFGFDTEIRFFRYERSSVVTYVDSVGNLLNVVSATDASGVGPRVGISYHHSFGKRFAFGGQFGVAAPIGELETRTLQQFPSENASTLSIDPGTTRVFLQLDAEIQFEARLVGGLSATASYGFQQWSGVERSQRFIDVLGLASTVPVEGDAIFEGFLLGLRYDF